MKVKLLSGSGEMELSPDVLDRPIAPTLRRVDLPNGDVLLIRMVAEDRPATTETMSETHKTMLSPVRTTGQSVSVFSPNMGRAEYADTIGVSSILSCKVQHDHAIEMLCRDLQRFGSLGRKVQRAICD